jgi:serine/threonine protein kinase
MPLQHRCLWPDSDGRTYVLMHCLKAHENLKVLYARIQELIEGQPLFPGESDVDQLYIIQRMLGPISPQQNVKFMQNPRFSGYKFGDEIAICPTTLRGRLHRKLLTGSLSEEALDFMSQCLRCKALLPLDLCRCTSGDVPVTQLTSHSQTQHGLAKWLCRMEPRDRPTAEACLRHSYLAGLHTATETQKAMSNAKSYRLSSGESARSSAPRTPTRAQHAVHPHASQAGRLTPPARQQVSSHTR